ncbi:hypothetical protein A7318_21895 [Pseudomonas lurida]|uniref:hypothetical protein n=1 Tax=Pseudomonas lurida TaxID=244566 RepID=UPI00083E4A13|nr:hypothetical protein [Pseudomonas lurida]AOE81139.1 hypothetical protein A7318_21895 [Pseudomonas lurida]
MGQDTFGASVQYNDLKGTAAADRHDNRDFSHYLEEKGLLNPGEALIGIELWSGEVHGAVQDKPVYVTALVSSGGKYETIHEEVISGQPVQVRKIDLEMPLNDFFGLFKRFAISISSFDLNDREIVFDD